MTFVKNPVIFTLEMIKNSSLFVNRLLIETIIVQFVQRLKIEMTSIQKI